MFSAEERAGGTNVGRLRFAGTFVGFPPRPLAFSAMPTAKKNPKGWELLGVVREILN